MARLHTPLCDILGTRLPIIQAPMAGGPSSPELVAACSAAGALGSFGFAYTPPEAGEYAFGASYAGDALNGAAASEVPLRHVVQAVQSGTVTRIDAPVTSEVGMEVKLVAFIAGNRPGGTVQFKRAGVKIAAKTVTKVVPIAGQVASAAIGFALFRKMGNQHVEACAKVAAELQKAKVVDSGTAQVPV